MYRSRRYWSDRVKELDLPLFPGYIFCRFDPLYRLPVLTSPGIASIIGWARFPNRLMTANRSHFRHRQLGCAGLPLALPPRRPEIVVTPRPALGVEGFLVNSKKRVPISRIDPASAALGPPPRSIAIALSQ